MNLLKQPQALFGFPATNRGALDAFDVYLNQVAQSISRCSWDQNVLELLDLVPQLFLKLGDDVELPVETIKVLSSHLHVTFLSYQRDHNPQLEDVIMLSSEYTYHLLELFRTNPEFQPCRPMEVYKKALLVDPDWALRWALERNDITFLPEIRQHLSKTKDINARSAFVYHRLATGHKERAVMIADIRQRLPLLMRDPQVCIWLAENYPELDKKVLFRSVLGNPAWMLIWAEKFPDVQSEMVRREIVRYPAWLPDYLARFNPPDAREMWLDSYQRCTNEWLAPWVENFGKAAKWA